MDYLEWSSDLETGIPEIDQQHQQIVSYINKLIDARRDHSVEVVAQVMDGLIEYTVTHFSYEEQLLKDAGYSGLGAHQSEHQKFISKINRLADRLKSGEDIATALLDVLKKWLVNHIKNEDGKYVPELTKGQRKSSMFSKLFN